MILASVRGRTCYSCNANLAKASTARCAMALRRLYSRSDASYCCLRRWLRSSNSIRRDSFRRPMASVSKSPASPASASGHVGRGSSVGGGVNASGSGGHIAGPICPNARAQERLTSSCSLSSSNRSTSGSAAATASGPMRARISAALRRSCTSTEPSCSMSVGTPASPN